MKVERRAIFFAALTLIFFTALPLASQMLIPSEFFRALSMKGGINMADLLNKSAVMGLMMAILVLMKGSVEKGSTAGLALSMASKIFWLVVVLLALGLGKIETLGLATLSSEGSDALNMVIFDLRLFAVHATIIVVLKMIYSLLEFKEARGVENGLARAGRDNAIES